VGVGGGLKPGVTGNRLTVLGENAADNLEGGHENHKDRQTFRFRDS